MFSPSGPKLRVSKRPRLAAVTIGELCLGVELSRHRGDLQQGQLLEVWLEQVLSKCSERVLVLDGDVAQLWGRLRVPDPRHAITKQTAAIALLYVLTFVTRNTADF